MTKTYAITVCANKRQTTIAQITQPRIPSSELLSRNDDFSLPENRHKHTERYGHEQGYRPTHYVSLSHMEIVERDVAPDSCDKR